jgi:hypothetical protein
MALLQNPIPLLLATLSWPRVLPGTLIRTLPRPRILPGILISTFSRPRVLPWALFATTLATLARLNVFSSRHVTFLSLLGGSIGNAQGGKQIGANREIFVAVSPLAFGVRWPSPNRQRLILGRNETIRSGPSLPRS